MRQHIYLGLGANLGTRAQNLREGLRLLAPEVAVLRVSSLYETDPIGFGQQPPFLNAVCEGETELDPEPLLDHLKAIERLLGRVPGPVWGPRPLDLDILLYGDALVDSPRLRIPHARLAEREFVLRPLAELDAGLVVPGLARSVGAMLRTVEGQGVRLVQSSGWQSDTAEPKRH